MLAVIAAPVELVVLAVLVSLAELAGHAVLAVLAEAAGAPVAAECICIVDILEEAAAAA